MTARTPNAPSVQITFVVDEKEEWRARRSTVMYASRSGGGAVSGHIAGIESEGFPLSGTAFASAPRATFTSAGGGVLGHSESTAFAADEMADEMIGGLLNALRSSPASVVLRMSQERLVQGKE